ncbi:MAG TPA: sensor domain-containing diguanylate cyclase [Acidobacteriaceae bacterium]
MNAGPEDLGLPCLEGAEGWSRLREDGVERKQEQGEARGAGGTGLNAEARLQLPGEREERRLAALYELAVLDTEEEQKYDDLTRLASFICDAPMSLISLVDRERQWFKSRQGMDLAETPRSEAICDYTVQQAELFIVEDAALDARFREMPLVRSGVIRFYAGTPILSPDGHSVGSLCVLDSVPRQLSEQQKNALQVLGRQAGAYLLISTQVRALLKSAEERRLVEQELRRSKEQLEEANRRLMELASTDALTGLANRRGMEARMRQKESGGEPALSMLMIDVDHFKRVNDLLSHETGDLVLQRVAALLRSCTRETDTLCRYGGEEFVLLLPGADHEAALQRAERLRQAVELDVDGVAAVTVSIGVATAQPDGRGVGLPGLLAAADKALYLAKAQGRNCVRSAGPYPERESDFTFE